jgi:diadenosine tetraphosphate (Ap4A) HIT family hydrolase
MPETKWERFSRGASCPLDAPRQSSNEHWEFVSQVNVESLGNVVPHLHWYIIPRYHDDAAS